MRFTHRSSSSPSHLRRGAIATIALVVVATAAVAGAARAGTAAGCRVAYTVTSQWSGGFGANIAITNLGDSISGWTLRFTFTSGQTITHLWNGNVSQSGGNVTITNAPYNGELATDATVTPGFNGTWNGSNPAPASFTLNGTPCTGAVVPTVAPPTTTPPTTTPPTSTPPTTTPPPGGGLPNSFRWSSSGVLIGPKSDASHNIRAVKDPSVVYHNGRWHVIATTTNQSGSYSMVYLNFTDWSQAAAAQHHFLDTTAIGTGYKAAPHVFYFAPQRLWYLVYQVGDNAAYSTNTDISNPRGWTAPRRFYAGGMPQIIRDNIGNGHWVDFWVICDSVKCHLFSSDDNGHLYRSETSLAQFPNGMSNTVIAMRDAARYPLWEAANVYRVSGGNQYLLIVEAIGAAGVRYFRSWTAPAITGPWSALADTQANPFAGVSNTTFAGTAWTKDISHGEMVRAGVDQTMLISPCNIRYLYQGKDPAATDSYNLLPWRLGLLTQTNSTC
ncbi:non-reducing end alpha-L-arabinofuranosidase family hydrolase [Verrucosispora sp. WMMA2044]|uniref:non-reducing end alpha-L-arabinofuranosidase family hydrolase n=1 Tax=unclassified Micromonospora TaxID=2617518 RepID=UPI0022B73A70|nr:MULTISPECIES: non-reducing end alpha-L-arabinofuranosidase family hydrolase [unclassified Micromonospora]MCZ7421114.1 non-reducing end alpha-L-arabinofuranosidase family hydrolase [Verrucosispora sp. WMMA2121]WBB47811.1 non-reducing end alpha-L-arabinofuranosidase family hydrolase [Verrucosispora sp. WMMA2044]